MGKTKSGFEMDEHHICITGFLQKQGSASAGLVKVWRVLSLNNISKTHTGTWLKSWDDNWDDFAELLHRFRNGGNPDIRIYAYSWGAGHGAIRLACALKSRGMQVREMVLADPVYCSRLLSFRWLALVSWLPFFVPRIVVPDNVREVNYFRQTINRPSGHPLVAADCSVTTIRDCGVIDYDHQHIDDAEEFHQACYRVARKD